MKSETTNIYCIDSSILITINRYYPSHIFLDLWKYLNELFKNRKILSHDMVFNEIVSSTGPKDEISKLIARYKSSFLPISNRQGQLALEILANFPRLIDVNSKKDQADPWIIAMVIEKMEEVSLFGDDSSYVIVSAESEKSDTKIPAVCKYYKIRHLNLFGFFEYNGWNFSISKRS